MPIVNITMKKNLCLLLLLFAFTPLASAQDANDDEDKPSGNLATPSDAFHTFFYYTQDEHYQTFKAAKVFYRRSKTKRNDNTFYDWDKNAERYEETEKPNKEFATAQELAVKLKQILDGKGIRIRISQMPADTNFRDSSSRKYIYHPFPIQLPEIYLERAKLDNGQYFWRFSSETIINIPKIHQQVYPWGSDKLLTVLPMFGEQKFLGLKTWQYITIVVLAGLLVLVYIFVSWLLRILIQFLANSRLGQDHFDPQVVRRIAKTIGYMFISYIIYVFIPILQLPVALGYYIIVSLRVFNTLCIILLGVRIADLAHSYFEHIVQQTPSNRDDHLLPIAIRIVKVVVWAGGIIHIFGIFEVNVTALVAGLSIGGLAIALAAQETVKNLIGSAMIYTDKPFQIGDVVKLGELEGTVLDIGFRSTRLRATDTSIVTIPNGGLADMTVVNLGAREMRRFRTNIGIANHTPPDLIDAFLKGMRELHNSHPKTHKEEFYIRLNNLTENTITILFIVFFETNEYAKELEYREDIILAILQLAHRLGIRISFPASSVYIESQPEKTSPAPDYKGNLDHADSKTQELLARLQADWQAKYPPNADADSTNNNPDKNDDKDDDNNKGKAPKDSIFR